MRAITGEVVSSEPCFLRTAYGFLNDFCSTPDSYLRKSDCATYAVTLAAAIKEQHHFLRRCGPTEQQQGAADLKAHDYEGLVEGKWEHQGGEKNRDTEKIDADSDLNSEKKKNKKKKKKKRGRGDNDDVQEQGEHKKKKRRKES